MKKILFAVIAALAITGCSQNEELDLSVQKGNEINFTTAAVTRATVTKSLRTFKAFGYAHNESYATSITGVNIMDGTYNSNDGTVWVEKDSKTFYWPVEGNVSFFAYSPVIEASDGSYSYTTGYPTVTYTIKDDITAQADFLVSKLENQTKGSNTGKVSLGFTHALTQVLFKLKGQETATYTVKNIAIKALKNAGTYDYLNATWSNTSGNKDYFISLDNKEFVGGDGGAVTLNGNDQLMILMPQNVDDIVVEVEYSAKLTIGNVPLFNGKKTAKLTGEWIAGEKYTYTLTLKAGDSMDVTGSVSDTWTEKTPNVPVEDNVAP